MSDQNTGMGGYKHRPVADDDPLVCVCGQTIGTQRMVNPDNRAVLIGVRTAHATECARRLAHQQRHRGPADECPECPRVAWVVPYYHVDDGSKCVSPVINRDVDTGYTCGSQRGSRWVAKRLPAETSTATASDGTVYP